MFGTTLQHWQRWSGGRDIGKHAQWALLIRVAKNSLVLTTDKCWQDDIQGEGEAPWLVRGLATAWSCGSLQLRGKECSNKSRYWQGECVYLQPLWWQLLLKYNAESKMVGWQLECKGWQNNYKDKGTILNTVLYLAWTLSEYILIISIALDCVEYRIVLALAHGKYLYSFSRA